MENFCGEKNEEYSAAHFDYVWCSGVLHHIKDPKKVFEIISSCVKPNGLIIIGLYNNIGRLRTNFRQLIYKLMGKSKIAKKIVFILSSLGLSLDL